MKRLYNDLKIQWVELIYIFEFINYCLNYVQYNPDSPSPVLLWPRYTVHIGFFIDILHYVSEKHRFTVHLDLPCYFFFPQEARLIGILLFMETTFEDFGFIIYLHSLFIYMAFFSFLT